MELFTTVLKLGLVPAISFIILYLFIQDPYRIIKLKAIITRPFFKMKRWFSRTYIASEVSSTVNQFFTKDLFNHLILSEETDFHVKWVRKAKDPLLKQGSLILRLKQDDDQTRNILNATKVALPQVICPLIRSNLNSHISSAIDLTLMQKLATKIGNHGKLTFKKYFLDPETKEDKRIGGLISELILLDKHGVFTPILLNELNNIGEGLFADSDTKDYSLETISFIKYLLQIVNRNIGEEIELNYIKPPFKVGSILLAVKHRADTQGLRPYLRRINIKVSKGCESLYIIAFPNSYKFFERLINGIDSEQRLNVEKIINTIDYSTNQNNRITNYKIAVLSTNNVFGPSSFKDKIEASALEVGEIYSGIVEDISQSEAIINLMGVRGYVKNSESGWNYSDCCNENLNLSEEYNFKITEIDIQSGVMHLTRKIDEENPWYLKAKPEVGEEIEVQILKCEKQTLYGTYDSLNVVIPSSEISWYSPISNEEIKSFVGNNIKVKVIEVNEDSYEIISSIKDLKKSPWKEIHKNLPKGTEFTGKVVEINHHFIRVDLGNSVIGILPKERLIEAGYEYKNYEENLKIGQGLDVFISKVFIDKQKIRLDLTRNKVIT